MKSLFIALFLLITASAHSASVVTDGGGQVIGLDSFDVTSFGLYDLRFHNTWQGNVETEAFANAAAGSLLAAFSGTGAFQGSVPDFDADIVRGCDSFSVCSWTTVFGEGFIPTTSGAIPILIGSVFSNARQLTDEFDKVNPPLTLTLSGALAGSVVTRTFLTWEESAVEVSAVPIPAAAFMFAPALLGFMGLRRRAKNIAA